MDLTLPDSERVLQQAPRVWRGQAGYVSVPVLFMPDQGYAAATVALAVGVDVRSATSRPTSCTAWWATCGSGS